jgi:hypothetical protein
VGRAINATRVTEGLLACRTPAAAGTERARAGAAVSRAVRSRKYLVLDGEVT